MAAAAAGCLSDSIRVMPPTVPPLISPRADFRQAVNRLRQQIRCRVGMAVKLLIHCRVVQAEIRAQVDHPQAAIQQCAAISAATPWGSARKAAFAPVAAIASGSGSMNTSSAPGTLLNRGNTSPNDLPASWRDVTAVISTPG